MVAADPVEAGPGSGGELAVHVHPLPASRKAGQHAALGRRVQDHTDGLAAGRFLAPAGRHGQRVWSGRVGMAGCGGVRMGGSTRGLRLGINPDSHPWADAAGGGPQAR